MTDRLKNNLGLKIIAVLFAILLWWAVVNIDDPIGTKNYRVQVTVTNPEVITNRGNSYQIINDTQNVTVTVKARRKVLNEIKASNIVATADMRENQENALIPIRISITGFEGMYEEATTNPRNVQIQVEATQKKTFPITVTTIGEPRDGYVVGDVSVSPQKVDISGPESLVAKISKVVAQVDVSEMSEDGYRDTQLIYYDAADNQLDKSRVWSNCDENGVTVKVSIWSTKQVGINFDTSQIHTADGFLFKEIIVEPENIKIAGTTEDLQEINEINVGAEALKSEGLKETHEKIIDIKEYLPEGIILADDTTGSVVVRIILEEVGLKTLLLPVRSVEVLNAPNNMELSYGPEQEVELKFKGSAEVLELLGNDKVTAVIDLANYKEEGTYQVPITVKEVLIDCEYVGSSTVEIVLKEKTE